MIQKILIANRGEISSRVSRTCRTLGIRSVAVYSEGDAGLPFVGHADQAVCIGPAAVADSYLNAEAILRAAAATGADAVHPGYGFLAENADFAQAVLDAGLTWIGPSPEAMRQMGDKSNARHLAKKAGVPTVPGFSGRDPSDEVLLKKARGVGFPLMVKASAGGGGRGMRLVHREEDLPEAGDHLVLQPGSRVPAYRSQFQDDGKRAEGEEEESNQEEPRESAARSERARP